MTLTETDLQHFHGSETLYKHSMMPRTYTYTEGVRHVAETGDAYWLIDAMMCAQWRDRVRREPFQVWTLTVTGTKAVLRCADGNGGQVYTQRIPYTDFPLASITFYLENDVLCLPTER